MIWAGCEEGGRLYTSFVRWGELGGGIFYLLSWLREREYNCSIAILSLRVCIESKVYEDHNYDISEEQRALSIVDSISSSLPTGCTSSLSSISVVCS